MIQKCIILKIYYSQTIPKWNKKYKILFVPSLTLKRHLKNFMHDFRKLLFSYLQFQSNDHQLCGCKNQNVLLKKWEYFHA